MTGAYRELPYVPDDLYSAADAITSAMGIDLPEDELRDLLRDARHTHRMVLSEWKRRNDPEWRAPRRGPRGKGRYDYGDMAGLGLPSWEAWWRENWGKEPGNPGLFRGTDIPMPPLVAIYHLVNRYWRDEMGLTFNPDFTGRHGGKTDAKRFDDLNRAAQIFLLVAQDAWPQYNSDLCERVHFAYYRQLNRAFKSTE